MLGLGSVDGVEGDGRLSLSKADAVTHEGTRYLTFADRVLNLSKVRDRIDELDDQLRAAVVGGDASAEAVYSRLGVDALPHEGGSTATVGSIDDVTPDEDADDHGDPAVDGEQTADDEDGTAEGDELFDEAFGEDDGGDEDGGEDEASAGDDGAEDDSADTGDASTEGDDGDPEDDEFFEF